MLRVIVVLLAGLLLCAQTPMVPGFPPGTFQNRAALDAAPAATYQGPGDIVSGALVFYSCSRVYNAAAASTSTSMCDLVAVTGGAAVGTIRGSTSGFADQTAYFAGSLTPAAACAAASGGSCKISKMYNQVSPGTLDVTQATLSSMPGILFSSTPAGTLPAVDCTGGTNALLATSSNPSISQPWTAVAVAKRPLSSSLQGLIGSASGIVNFLGGGNVNNTLAINAGTTVTAASTDGSWHSMAGVLNGASSVLTVDATDNTGLNAGTTAWGANALRVCRNGSGGASWAGQIAETGIWSGTGFTTGGGGQTQLMQDNQHGAANGYNF